MFQGKEVPRFELPDCPGCGERSLVRHGTYIRPMLDEYGTEHPVKIQRVRCGLSRECGTHSLLYDILVPYCKSSFKELEKAVTAYVKEPNTYLGALNEAVSEAATLFRAVKMMLTHLPDVWMYLMRMLIAAGYSVENISKGGSSPNSFKCRTEKKREELDWAAQLIELVPNVFEIASCHGFPLFASGRSCRLLRTHSRECALF